MKKFKFNKVMSLILTAALFLTSLTSAVPALAAQPSAEEEQKVTVTFKKDGASGADTKIEVPKDKPIDLLFPTSGLIKTVEEYYEDVEYSLVGWSTTKGSKTPDVFANTKFSSPTTVWPIWKTSPGQVEKPVYFAPNGGEGGPTQITLIGRINKLFPTEVPIRPKHEFLGWATSKDAISPDVDADTYISKYTVLYAVWKKEVENIPVAKVTLSEENLNLKKGNSKKLTASTEPSDATDTTIEWKSSAEQVATVSEDGTVNAVSPGTAVITATAKSGVHAECNVTVEKMSLSEYIDIADIPAVTYTGQALSPAYELIAKNGQPLPVVGKDFDVSYSDNINAGKAMLTLTAKGDYQGSVSKEFDINPKAIDNIEAEYTNSIEETGEIIHPEAKLQLDDVVLVVGRDYDIDYVADDSKPGEYSFTVNAKGNFTGSKEFKYTVKKKPDPVVEKKKIESCSFAKISQKTFTGKKLYPSLKIVHKGKKLVYGVDYKTVTSHNVNPGIAQTVVTGIGDFEGSKRLYFRISPAKLITNRYHIKKGGYMSIKWKRQKNISGYQILISRNRNFKKSIVKTVFGSKKYKLDVKKLYRNKAYYVKGRAFVIAGNSRIYGEFSKVSRSLHKYVKVKKSRKRARKHTFNATVHAKKFKDGIYRGEAQGWHEEIPLAFMVKDGNIVSMHAGYNRETPYKFRQAWIYMKKAILESQSYEIPDFCVGATKSSIGIKNAMANAYSKDAVDLSKSKTIFLNGTLGDDETEGQVPEMAVKTLKHAAKLANKTKKKIVVIGSTEVKQDEEVEGTKAAPIVIQRGDWYPSALLNVKSNLKLKNIVFDGKPAPPFDNDPVLDDSGIISGSLVSVSQGASLDADDCGFKNNISNLKGSGILSEGDVDLSDCYFSKNKSKSDGGAIYSKGNLKIDDCSFSENAAQAGGAIFSNTSESAHKTSVNDSKFYSNSASSEAGAIALKVNDQTSVSDSMFKNNKANRGAAIALTSGSLSLDSVTAVKNLGKEAVFAVDAVTGGDDAAAEPRIKIGGDSFICANKNDANSAANIYADRIALEDSFDTGLIGLSNPKTVLTSKIDKTFCLYSDDSSKSVSYDAAGKTHKLVDVPQMNPLSEDMKFVEIKKNQNLVLNLPEGFSISHNDDSSKLLSISGKTLHGISPGICSIKLSYAPDKHIYIPVEVLDVTKPIIKPKKPAAPTHVTIRDLTNGRLSLSWKSVKGANKYVIYKKYDGKYKTYVKTVHTRIVLSSAPGQRVYYKIAAVDSKGTIGQLSKYVTALSLPKAPKLSYKRYDRLRKKIMWAKNSKAKGYIIYLMTSKGKVIKRIKTIKSNRITKYVTFKLAKKKNFFFAARSFATYRGQKVYSRLSKKIRIKL